MPIPTPSAIFSVVESSVEDSSVELADVDEDEGGDKLAALFAYVSTMSVADASTPVVEDGSMAMAVAPVVVAVAVPAEVSVLVVPPLSAPALVEVVALAVAVGLGLGLGWAVALAGALAVVLVVDFDLAVMLK